MTNVNNAINANPTVKSTQHTAAKKIKIKHNDEPINLMTVDVNTHLLSVNNQKASPNTTIVGYTNTINNTLSAFISMALFSVKVQNNIDHNSNVNTDIIDVPVK